MDSDEYRIDMTEFPPIKDVTIRSEHPISGEVTDFCFKEGGLTIRQRNGHTMAEVTLTRTELDALTDYILGGEMKADIEEFAENFAEAILGKKEGGE